MSSNLFSNTSYALQKLTIFVLFAAVLLATGQARAATIAADPAAASASVERWTCIHIPGAGTYCGENGVDDDPKEK
jgi:hypothetical protein